MDTKYVYEVRDISNDEIYYPLGIFLNLDDAKKQILGTEVFSVRRERDYQEETGNYYWELVEQNEF